MALPERRLTLPEDGKRQLDRFERLGSHDRVLPEGIEEDPAAGVQSVDFQCFLDWIDQPRMSDAFTPVDPHLLAAVDDLKARGEDLAHPIRGDVVIRRTIDRPERVR